MRILLPFEAKGIGGTATFAAKFKQGMESLGHTVITELGEDYDVLFMIVQCPFKYLRDAKQKGRPIVQRLDGVYYWSVAGWKFPLLNAKALLIRHFYTDFTVYQSLYSQTCANRFLGRKRLDRHAVIYNGVDLELFSPAGPKAKLQDMSGQTVFFTASAFRRPDQIEPILAALKVYKKKFGSNFKLALAGSFKGRLNGFDKTLASKNTQLLGPIKNPDLPPYERAADVFLFTHLNPPCPNNVIEALAAGLPICGVNDGAMSELVTPGKTGELSEAHGQAFWQERTYNAEQFADNLHRIVKRKGEYSALARASAEKRFSLAKMLSEYVKVFEKLVN